MSSVALYCFAERRQEVFTESLIRGYLAGLLDFPRFKPLDDRRAPGQAAIEALRSEVCCVEDEVGYGNLARTAWYTGYQSATEERQRDAVQMVMVYKQMPEAEALRQLRRAFASEQGQSLVAELYEKCCATVNYFVAHPDVYAAMAMRSAAGDLAGL